MLPGMNSTTFSVRLGRALNDYRFARLRLGWTIDIESLGAVGVRVQETQNDEVGQCGQACSKGR